MRGVFSRNGTKTGPISVKGFEKPLFIFAVALVLAARFNFCFQVPTRTTDTFRHIGYTSHLWTHGPAIYKTRASDFKPEAWASNWGEVGYIYPPFTLVFFSLFSLFGAGIAWAKLAFTFCDIGSAYLLAEHSSKWMGLLLLSMPSMVWWTSHEGQFESVHLLLMILCCHFALRGRFLPAGVFLGLGIQTKLFSVLLLPFLAVEIYKDRSKLKERFKFLSLGVAVAFAPFLPFYFSKPTILLMPFRENTTLAFNPFAWNFLDSRYFKYMPAWLIGWNAFFSDLIVVLLVLMMIRQRAIWQRWIATLTPLGFWVVVKSLRWAHFWYPIQFPALLFPFKGRIFATFLVLTFFLDASGAAYTLGIEHGRKEFADKVEQMKRCLLKCDYKQLATDRPHGSTNGN